MHYRIIFYSPDNVNDSAVSFDSEQPFMNFNKGDFINLSFNDEFNKEKSNLSSDKDNMIQIAGINHDFVFTKGMMEHVKRIFTKFVPNAEAVKQLYK